MNKVALITGANKGIGFETARQLGRQGIAVLIGSRNKDNGEKAAAALRAEGIDAQAVQLNVTDEADIKAVRSHIGEKYGRLDILVNNAGIVQGEEFFGNSSNSIAQADLRATFDTNLFAVVNLTQQLLPLVEKSEAGRIVNLSSVLGSLTLHASPESPIAPMKSMAYNASKAALNAYTIHLADALKDTKIKVNSAHPGWVKTEMGGEVAPMEIVDGAKTSVALATLGEDGPTGRYIHMGEELPW